MKKLTVSSLLCVVMALTAAAGLHRSTARPKAEDEPVTEETVTEGLPVREDRRWVDALFPSRDTRVAERSTCCPRGWTAFKGRCFLFVKKRMNWAQAEENCLSKGGNLASIHSRQEYREIQKMVLKASGSDQTAWVGGSDAQNEKFWFWSDGTPFNFDSWCCGEPNNGVNHDQHCLQINYSAKRCWDDLQCGDTRPSVCAKSG